MRLSFRLVASALLGGGAGCGDPTAPPARATIVVRADTVVATVSAAGSIDWMHFTLPVAIHNADRRSIHFEYCASAVEEPAADGWRAVWRPVCLLVPGSPVEIRPGETRELSLEISAAVRGPGGPFWASDEVTGTYRFSSRLTSSRSSGVVPLVGSNTFVLVER